MYLLGTIRGVRVEAEYELRRLNFKREMDPGRRFKVAFRVTWISDNWYKTNIGVIVIDLETCWFAGEIFGRTWGCHPTNSGIPNKL